MGAGLVRNDPTWRAAHVVLELILVTRPGYCSGSFGVGSPLQDNQLCANRTPSVYVRAVPSARVVVAFRSASVAASRIDVQLREGRVALNVG